MGVKIRISVRNLVEFLLRSGDIDSGTGRIDTDAMAMGRVIHKKIQKSAGAGYRAEVPLSDTADFPEDGFSLTVEGRADGIQEDGRGITVDEIKGMYRDVKEFTEPIPVHLAQAKCYAYMYLKQRRGKENPEVPADETSGGKNEIRGAGKDAPGVTKTTDGSGESTETDRICVQLTYVNLDTEEVRRLRKNFTYAELEDWYRDLVMQYRPWAVWTVRHQEQRTASIRRLAFPYPYREGQRKLVASVYRTIEQKRKLFIQAPTGSGKTLATVFPAVKAVGEGLAQRVFYLTARTVTRTVAEECFRILSENGLDFRTVTITAKEKVCPVLPALREKDEDAGTPCSPDSCPYAKGHYDRVNAVLYDLLMSGDPLGRERILQAAEEQQVCPFELTLDLTAWADGIICDYNYAFDPNARLQRFFGSDAKSDSILLIDEAHNLVDRGREMYSADLCRSEFLELRRELKTRRTGQDVQKVLSACLSWLLSEKKALSSSQSDVPSFRNWRTCTLGTFPVLLAGLSGTIETFLEKPQDGGLSDQVLRFYFRVLAFTGAAERFTEKYRAAEEITETGDLRIRIMCLDPSSDLQACMDRGRASVLFSATLLPIAYYRSLLSGRADDYAVYASSSFDPSRRKILIGRDVSTRYQDRGPETYRRIASYIRKVTCAREGNYMVFFSSYRMLEDTLHAYEEIRPEKSRVIAQHSRMTEREREAFLSEFDPEKSGGHGTLTGFCVMGSFFGEGIDLKGERLIGVIVVGTGLPQVGPEREILRAYFDSRGMDGFFYAYTCPGMAKVLQAAGRVIRTEEDSGTVVLIDERFARAAWRSMFPREWSDAEYVTLDDVGPRLEQFWKTL